MTREQGPMHSMRTLRLHHVFVLAFFLLALPCRGQGGMVAFYSMQPGVGHQIANVVIPAGKAPFTGFLFDGNERLAHARGGRFMTFRFPAGEHQFYAAYHPLHPGDPMHLTIENGGFYCVRLSATYKSGSIMIPLAIFHSSIEQVPCDQAAKEAAEYKPLESKRIVQSVLPKLVSTPGFPKNP